MIGKLLTNISGAQAELDRLQRNFESMRAQRDDYARDRDAQRIENKKLEAKREAMDSLLKGRDETIEGLERFQSEIIAALGLRKHAGRDEALSRARDLNREATTGSAAKLRMVRNSYLDACRAIAEAAFGPGAEPIYDGEGVAGGWPGMIAKRIDELRTQNSGLVGALIALVPWLDQQLKKEGRDEDIVEHYGQARGSNHELVLRRRDLRLLREIIEQVR
jgi:hypothetical protein